MTTEQKLDLFTSYALNKAATKQKNELTQYEQSLKEEFEKKRDQYEKEREEFYRKKVDLLNLNCNRTLSNEAMKQRHEFVQQKEHMIKQLFTEVKDQLKQFKKTERYLELLKEQISSVQTLASGFPFKIYLDESDTDLIPTLSKLLNVDLKISKHSLIGGILAKIPEKNLLIDETMNSKLTSAKDSFTII